MYKATICRLLLFFVLVIATVTTCLIIIGISNPVPTSDINSLDISLWEPPAVEDATRAPLDGPVPIYYMNLKRSKDRRVYMDNMFRKYLKKTDISVTRIDAADLANMTDIGVSLGIDPNENFEETISKFCKPATAVVPNLTYFKAMAKAYEDGAPYALIMEDDASFELVPFWPLRVNQLVAEMESIDPGWHCVRLSYTFARENEKWAVFNKWKATYPNLPSVTSFQNPHPPTDSGYHGVVWGVVATLWSRRALGLFTRKFVNLNGRRVPEHSDDPLSRYTYTFRNEGLEPAKCVFDNFINYIGLKQYLATPPYFTYRIAEGALGARTGSAELAINDHALGHLSSRAFAMQFMSEYLELQETDPAFLPSYKLVAESLT